MKQPKLKELRLDKKGTEQIRRTMQNQAKVKITINIDADNLSALRQLADSGGGSYQRLLNKILRDGLKNRTSSDNRLERIERELAKLKKLIAA